MNEKILQYSKAWASREMGETTRLRGTVGMLHLAPYPLVKNVAYSHYKKYLH